MREAQRLDPARALVVLVASGVTFVAACVTPAPVAATPGDQPEVGADGTVVAVDPAAVERDPATLRLPVPEGTRAVRRERVVRRNGRDLTWYGRAVDPPGGDVVVTVVNGSMVATMETARGTVVLTPAGPGRGRVRRLARSGLTAGTERVLPAPAPAALAAPEPTFEAPASEATVDVMIAYGSAMLALHGEAGTAALAQNAVDRANLALWLSGTGVQFRLVAAVNMSRYEAHIAGLEQVQASTLIRLIRTMTGADLVQAWGDYERCGAGYQHQGSPVPTWGFSAVSVRCVPSVAPVHEWGHNLGAGHDRETDADHPGDRAFPDSYGFVSPEGGFATVMAYDTPTCPPEGCERAPLFSNIVASWRGVPAGEAGRADNARAIRLLAPGVAAYRSTIR
jgi:hypothetical protein